jgi:hypothetical protein
MKTASRDSSSRTASTFVVIVAKRNFRCALSPDRAFVVATDTSSTPGLSRR